MKTCWTINKLKGILNTQSSSLYIVYSLIFRWSRIFSHYLVRIIERKFAIFVRFFRERSVCKYYGDYFCRLTVSRRKCILIGVMDLSVDELIARRKRSSYEDGRRRPIELSNELKRWWWSNTSRQTDAFNYYLRRFSNVYVNVSQTCARPKGRSKSGRSNNGLYHIIVSNLLYGVESDVLDVCRHSRTVRKIWVIEKYRNSVWRAWRISKKFDVIFSTDNGVVLAIYICITTHIERAVTL